MGIIHTILSRHERHTIQLSARDSDYLRKQLETNSLLNSVMHRPINHQLLLELQCLLDGERIPRRKAEHRRGCGLVRVFKNNQLIRVERGTGKVLCDLEGDIGRYSSMY